MVATREEFSGQAPPELLAAMTKPMRIREGRGTAYYKENVL